MCGFAFRSRLGFMCCDSGLTLLVAGEGLFSIISRPLCWTESTVAFMIDALGCSISESRQGP